MTQLEGTLEWTGQYSLYLNVSPIWFRAVANTREGAIEEARAYMEKKLALEVVGEVMDGVINVAVQQAARYYSWRWFGKSSNSKEDDDSGVINTFEALLITLNIMQRFNMIFTSRRSCNVSKMCFSHQRHPRQQGWWGAVPWGSWHWPAHRW